MLSGTTFHDGSAVISFISPHARSAFYEARSVSFHDCKIISRRLCRHFIHFGVLISDNLVLDLSMQFAIDIVNLCEALKGKNALINQLLRSGTSIGANIHEANYASSRADFVAKMQIALRECHETEYWLKLFVKTGIINEDIYQKLSNNGGKIRRILIASINTTKDNS